MTTTQLRRYEIQDGQMEAFLHYWHKLIAQREKFGFRVVFAYVDETNNDLVWAVEHAGTSRQPKPNTCNPPNGPPRSSERRR